MKKKIDLSVLPYFNKMKRPPMVAVDNFQFFLISTEQKKAKSDYLNTFSSSLFQHEFQNVLVF